MTLGIIGKIEWNKMNNPEELFQINPYGVLNNQNDLSLYRGYFEEMVSFIGVKCIYKAVKKNKHYSDRGDLKSNYEEGVITGCIFTEHPDVKTLKKLGWVTELSESSSLIHVPFDLRDLQVGALFIIPDTLNPKQGRVFRVTKMSATMIYPASITCEIIPEWRNTFESSQLMYKNTDFNLLNTEDEWHQSEWEYKHAEDTK